MREMRRALVCLLVLSGLVRLEAQSVQRFDQPVPGARSPRNANYTIDVTLDHARRTLTGRETIRWRNISANPTSELQFHLYWNAWRNDQSTWLRERQLAGNFVPPRADAWGSMDVSAIRVGRPGHTGAGGTADLTSHQRFIAPDDGNTADRTVMAVTLPFAVASLETLEIEVEWTGKIPRPFARTGSIDDYYFIAQWFPKLGVLEDRGWNTHQFHAATEFYSDYGEYDVRISLPAEFVVGATGCPAPEAPDAAASCGADASAPGTGAASRTHRYRAEDVHDFAWTASPHFLDLKQPFSHPGLPTVSMRLLLQPEHAGQAERHFAATAATLRHYGEWFGPYTYEQITIVDPAFQSGSGGMEYPTLFTAGTRWLAPARVPQPQRVTIHEAGHQFWYGIVGTNEFEHAWMDEGLNTFSEARTLEASGMPNDLALRFFGGFVPWRIDDIPLSRATDGNRLYGYRENAAADAQATPTYRFWPGTATFITYNKTALWLHTLERHLGWPTLQRIMSTFFERWKFRHPQPDDFFAAANDVSGRDLRWFFDDAYGSARVFDYGVQSFTSTRSGDRFRTTVVVRKFGEGTFPVDVVTTFRDGERVSEQWDGRERRVIYTYDRPSQAVSTHVDPGRVLLLDVNYTNNSAAIEPRGADASLKWSLKWLVWLQDLMLTYAFFV